MIKIKFQEIYRDSVQSLFGTNPSAREIVNAHPHLMSSGVQAVQLTGGTFFAVMADKERNPLHENDILFKEFSGKNDVELTALVRGDFLVGYEPYPYDVVKAYVRFLANKGVTQIQNFHGLNDTRLQESVAQACNELSTQENLSISAQGAICIETNSNITLSHCMENARDLIALGHKGFYLKCASGVVEPDFVRDLTKCLAQEFPKQQIGVHIHATYGKAEACYIAALEGAYEAAAAQPQDYDKTPVTVQLDVAHPALSGATGHPSMLDMLDLIMAHSNEEIRKAAPLLDKDVIARDNQGLREMRLRYRDFETVLNPDLIDLMEQARVPGGASSTLKSIPGFVDNIANVLGTQNWTEIQKAVYVMQAEILHDLGDPTQVTPYAANTTGQAGISLYTLLKAVSDKPDLINGIEDINGCNATIWVEASDRVNIEGLRAIIKALKDDFAFINLYAGKDNQSAIVAYLVGKHGKVPNGVNKDLQNKALLRCGVDREIYYIKAADKAPILTKLKGDIASAASVYAAAINDEMALVAALTKVPVSQVYAFVNDTEAGAKKIASIPKHLKGTQDQGRSPTDVIEFVGGAALVQEIVEHAIQIKQIDGGFYEALCAQDIVNKWRQEALDRVAYINNSVDEMLDYYAEGKPNINLYARSDFMLDQLKGKIKEALNHRYNGLHDFMCAQLSLAQKTEVCDGAICYGSCPIIVKDDE